MPTLRAHAVDVAAPATNVSTPTKSAAPAIPDDVVAVAESGIHDRDDLRRLRDAGFGAFLIGERLMGAPDPGQALRELLEESA